MDIGIRHAEPHDAAAVKSIPTDEAVMLGTMRLPFVPDAQVDARIAAAESTYKLVADTWTRI